MRDISPASFRTLLENAGIAIVGLPAKESLLYQPYGAKIRDLMYSQAMQLLDEAGYQRTLLSDVVLPENFKEIDKVSPISGGYMKITGHDLMIAAGHEVNAYLYMKELLRHQSTWNPLPLKIYNWGPIYRTNKNTKFPFNLGERKSFLECYSLFSDESAAKDELDFAKKWNRKVLRDAFHLPSVEVLRPLSTNKKISKQTTCIDSLTPFGETVITGMTYFHDDIFTRALNLKCRDERNNKNRLTYSTHFGISDHTYFSYLLNSCDGRNLRLLSSLAPIQVSLLDCLGDNRRFGDINIILSRLRDEGIRTEYVRMPLKKIPFKISRNTMQGIPVSLIFKKADGNEEIHLVYRGEQRRLGNGSSEILSEANLNRLVNLVHEHLIMNDREIIVDMECFEQERIISCDSLDKLDEFVRAGYVAKIYLENTDENVALVESRLFGGETLGFSQAQIDGEELISHMSTKSIAYVSRRS